MILLRDQIWRIVALFEMAGRSSKMNGPRKPLWYAYSPAQITRSGMNFRAAAVGDDRGLEGGATPPLAALRCSRRVRVPEVCLVILRENDPSPGVFEADDAGYPSAAVFYNPA